MKRLPTWPTPGSPAHDAMKRMEEDLAHIVHDALQARQHAARGNLEAAVKAADRMFYRRYFWTHLAPLSASVTGVALFFAGVALSERWWNVVAWFAIAGAAAWLPAIASQVWPLTFARIWRAGRKR